MGYYLVLGTYPGTPGTTTSRVPDIETLGVAERREAVTARALPETRTSLL